MTKELAATITLFSENRANPSLRDHALTGRMEGKNSFSVNYDIRVIYRLSNDGKEAVLLDVGTHKQVYK